MLQLLTLAEVGHGQGSLHLFGVVDKVDVHCGIGFGCYRNKLV